MDYLKKIREGRTLSVGEQLAAIAALSIPSVLAQLTTTVMNYIDAAMVGSLGANASASIGLVSSSIWLFNTVTNAAVTGFTVQVAQSIGAGREKEARGLVRLGLVTVYACSLLFMFCAFAIFRSLPMWLGGAPEIRADASVYFLIIEICAPIFHISSASAGMLQAEGNMRTPSILQIMMCCLDVVFNRLLIYDSSTLSLFGSMLVIPGAGLGVAGAALGTGLAQITVAFIMLYMLLVRSKKLHLRRGDRLPQIRPYLRTELIITCPIAFENVLHSGAQVFVTGIVAPLGTVSVAANSLSVTAESFCYMPGYGIAGAATTLIGQSYGAGRKDMIKKLGYLTVFFGMAVMTCTGALMYIFAPQIIGMLSPVEEVRELGTAVLRIEAFAEPLYAAALVCPGVMRGTGDTLIPSLTGMATMWLVRLPAAALLAPVIGLRGVWFAMALQLSTKGVLLLIRLFRGKWLRDCRAA